MVAAAVIEPTAVAAGDEDDVKKAVDALYKAYVDVDSLELDKLLADQVNFGHSDGRVEEKRKVIDDVLSKRFLFRKFTIESQSLAMAGNVSIVRHIVTIEAETEGKTNSGKANILQVWQKQGANWRLLVRQALPLRI